jgi:hypothetical protein
VNIRKRGQAEVRSEKLQSGLLTSTYERFDTDENSQGSHDMYQHFPYPLTSSSIAQDLNPLFITLFQKILLLSHEILNSQQAKTDIIKNLLDLSTALETFVSVFHTLEKTEHTNASDDDEDEDDGEDDEGWKRAIL